MPDPAPPQPPVVPPKPRKPFPFRKLIALGMLGAMLLSCAGMCIACSGLTWYLGSGVGRGADRVFHEALADGDRDEIYRRADADFRAAYSEAELRGFAKAQPNLFDRAKLDGLEWRRTTLDDKKYYVLIARVADEGIVAFYCKLGDSGKLVLVGISPATSSGEGLDKAVPPDVRRLGVV
jgi:hypothetical protein